MVDLVKCNVGKVELYLLAFGDCFLKLLHFAYYNLAILRLSKIKKLYEFITLLIPFNKQCYVESVKNLVFAFKTPERMVQRKAFDFNSEMRGDL